MGILKVQTWGEGQGDYVIIDEETFDHNFHKLYSDKDEKKESKTSNRKGVKHGEDDTND